MEEEFTQPVKKRGRPKKANIIEPTPNVPETDVPIKKRGRPGPTPSDPVSLSRRIGDAKCIANLQNLTAEQFLEVFGNIKRMYDAILLQYDKNEDLKKVRAQIDTLQSLTKRN